MFYLRLKHQLNIKECFTIMSKVEEFFNKFQNSSHYRADLSFLGETVYVSFDLAPEEEADFSLTEFTKTALDFVCKSKIQLSCDSLGNIRLTKSKF